MHRGQAAQTFDGNKARVPMQPAADQVLPRIRKGFSKPLEPKSWMASVVAHEANADAVREFTIHKDPLLAPSAEDRGAGCPDAGSPQHHWDLEAKFYSNRKCAGLACALGCSR